WHEPLADDDNRHLIVTQDDDNSLLALTRLIEREPLAGGNADIVSPRPAGWKRPRKYPRKKVSA
ncbi:MAG: hypothetical protein KDE23_27055, partial [Caldilinea sp.]|nr:hypothetical protein [Caldilinea sp.]